MHPHVNITIHDYHTIQTSLDNWRPNKFKGHAPIKSIYSKYQNYKIKTNKQ